MYVPILIAFAWNEVFKCNEIYYHCHDPKKHISIIILTHISYFKTPPQKKKIQKNPMSHCVFNPQMSEIFHEKLYQV